MRMGQMRMGITTYRYCSCSGAPDICGVPSKRPERLPRLQFAGALLVFQQSELHFVLRDCAEKIQQVLCVEADLEIRSRVFGGTLSSDSPVSSAEEKTLLRRL